MTLARLIGAIECNKEEESEVIYYLQLLVRITTSLSTPDSTPQTSPVRPRS